MVLAQSVQPIAWRRLPGESTSEEAVAAVENHFGIRFPKDFRSAFPSIHGASPAPSKFYLTSPRIGRMGTSLGAMLSLAPESMYYVPTVADAHEGEGILPRKVVPFGIDGGGDLVAFDFRADAANPTVVYVAIASSEEHSDRHIIPLAESFTEFLNMLQQRDVPDPHPEGR